MSRATIGGWGGGPRRLAPRPRGAALGRGSRAGRARRGDPRRGAGGRGCDADNGAEGRPIAFGGMMATEDALRSALFVDLDNILIGLRKLDAAAAETAGSVRSRNLWVRIHRVGWIGSPRGEDQGGYPRRFLVKYVYLNPASFGPYRAFFTRSGFRVIDCPSLTVTGQEQRRYLHGD